MQLQRVRRSPLSLVFPRCTIMHLYTPEVVEEEATMTTNVQLHGAVCIYHKGLLLPISIPQYQCAQGAKAPLIQHTGQHH